MEDNIVIAIDGPGGSGKSTVACMLSKRLGYLYVNTGAMYRAVALKTINSGISPDDDSAVVDLIPDTEVRIALRENGDTDIFLDGINVTNRVRQPDVTSRVSQVSAIQEVRHWLVREQRKAAKTGNIVCEGRDIGTVVFPSAQFKFYLTASLEERVKRRLGEYADRDVEIEADSVKKELEKRDIKDSTRKISPLRKADDAIEIDTTDMKQEEVVNKLLQKVHDN